MLFNDLRQAQASLPQPTSVQLVFRRPRRRPFPCSRIFVQSLYSSHRGYRSYRLALQLLNYIPLLR